MGKYTLWVNKTFPKIFQIPLTFIDDLQSFPDILIELENIVENIEPTSQANITARDRGFSS